MKTTIVSLELKNFKQHRDKTWTFVKPDGTPASLIGLVGPNGRGKSGILDALLFLFTGSIPDTNKEELVSWGTAPDAAAYVKGVLSVDGVTTTIVRHTNKGTASFSQGDRKVSGITNVNAAIAEMGLDPEVCQNSVFVRQQDLTKILFTVPSERRKAWQKLAGLSSAAKVYETLGNVINGTPVDESGELVLKDYWPQLRAARARLHSIKAELAAKDVKDLQCRLDTARMDVTAHETAIAQLKQRNALKVTIQAMEKSVDVSKYQLEALKKDRAAVTLLSAEERTVFSAKVSVLQDEIRKANASVSAAKDLEAAKLTRKAAEEDLAAVLEALTTGDHAGRIALAEERRLKAQTEATEAQQGLALRQRLLPVAGDCKDPVCPLCRSVIKNIAEIQTLLKSEIEELERKKRTADTLAAEMGQHERTLRYEHQKLQQQQNESNNLMERLDERMKQLDATLYGNYRTETDVAPLRDALFDLDQKLRVDGVAREASASLDIKVAAQESTLQAQTEELVRNRELLATWKEPDKPEDLHVLCLAGAKDVVMKTTAELDACRKCEADVTAAVTSIKGMIATMRAAKNRMAAELDKRKRLEVLKDVRDFFNSGNGPALVVSGLLKDMLPSVNGFLKYFNSPYSVLADYDKLMFNCMFSDGRPTPDDPPSATVLSGGQKVALSIAFRLAAYQHLSGRLGFMTLDEPTVNLDEENVANFVSLTERLKTLTTQMGLQIFISTHEPSIRPYMDYVIDLGEETTTP